MTAKRLAVLLYGNVIGHLEREDTALPTFTYTAEYAAQGQAPLSARLPIATDPYQPRRVEPYLRGLLPEDPTTLQQWAEELDVHADDVFAMLAEMGWDCPGAVQFCPEDAVETLLSRAGEYHPVSDGDIAERLVRLQTQPAAWTMPDEHWSLGGQQEKIALARLEGSWFEAHGSAATTHILKPGIKILLHQALVEHVTMQAAKRAGLTVATTTMLQFEDQWAIVVERFDRVATGERVLRLHQEDFCQALGRLPGAKYESRGGPAMSDMAKLIRRDMTSPDDDAQALADFVAVNLIAGAPDGHSKNISLLVAPNGRRWVAPLYDLATGLTYDREVERTVAVSIGGERAFSRIRRKQWEKAARILDIGPSVLLLRVANLAEAFPQAFQDALDEMTDIPGADQVAERTLPALEQHCGRLLDQLDASTLV